MAKQQVKRAVQSVIDLENIIDPRVLKLEKEFEGLSQQLVCDAIWRIATTKDATIARQLIDNTPTTLKRRMGSFLEKYAPISFTGNGSELIYNSRKQLRLNLAVKHAWWLEEMPKRIKNDDISETVSALKKEISALKRHISSLDGQIARQEREIEELKKKGYKS
jgi:hypothetical protein